jgi:hypothetical protein
MRTCQLRGHVRRAVRSDDRQATHLHSIRELEFGACDAYRAESASHVSASASRGRSQPQCAL